MSHDMQYTYTEGAEVPCNVVNVIIDPSSIKISAMAFGGCRNLTSVIIPVGSSLSIIEEEAFLDCVNLREFILQTVASPQSQSLPPSSSPSPSSPCLTHIGAWAFSGCSSIVTLCLPESLVVIERFSFQECYGLCNITLPSSLTAIEQKAFYGCSSLEVVTIIDGMLSSPSSTADADASLSPSMASSKLRVIGEGAFEFCYSLISIDIPASVTIVGDNAFYACSSLQNVAFMGRRDDPQHSDTFQNSDLGTIGCSAFGLCPNLTSITFPFSLHSISLYAFRPCTTSIIIHATAFPTSTITIGNIGTSQYDSFEAALYEAGFSRKTLHHVISSGSVLSPPPSSSIIHSNNTFHSSSSPPSSPEILQERGMFYDSQKWWNKCSRIRDPTTHRLPLLIAAERNLPWLSSMKPILESNMVAIEEVDDAKGMTGLAVFMLAAVGCESSLESTFRLLRTFPPAMFCVFREEEEEVEKGF